FVGNIEEGLPIGTVKQILSLMNKRNLLEN
ncbi:uncharacterized protein METZ01_LOCUS147361, partial [marine metagenome]